MEGGEGRLEWSMEMGRMEHVERNEEGRRS